MKRNSWAIAFFLLLLWGGLLPAFGAELIAIAADTNQASSLVGRNAARSAYYLIFAGTGELLEVLENPYRAQRRGAGAEAVDFLARKGVTIIVAENFSPGIATIMQARGVKAVQYRGVARDAVTRIQAFPERKDIPTKGDNNHESVY
jgi:predicted Fe-Mo cluster-binding NifX family protein